MTDRAYDETERAIEIALCCADLVHVHNAGYADGFDVMARGLSRAFAARNACLKVLPGPPGCVTRRHVAWLEAAQLLVEGWDGEPLHRLRRRRRA